MKWVTRKEVVAAGKKSKRAAIANCKKHWKQIATCTEKEFEVANDMGNVDIGDYYCALCQRYVDCKDCPLYTLNSQCCKEFGAADNALDKWYWEDRVRFSTFQKKALKVYERLCEL